MKYKILILSLIIILLVIKSSFAQKKDTTIILDNNSNTICKCINYLHITIPHDSLDRNLREKEFKLYFRVDDSVFLFKHGDSFCLDSGKTKNVSLFFFYQKRMISFDSIILKSPFWSNYLYITYFPIEEFKPYPKKIAKKEGWLKLYKRNKKNLFCENDDIPLYFPEVKFLGKKLNLKDLYYGAALIHFGRVHVYSLDRKYYM